MPNTTSLAQCSTWPPTPNAHTYRLLIFKEQAFNELYILAQPLYTLQETSQKSPYGVRAFHEWVSDDVLLSRARAHYHRRKSVSRSCSGWAGVVPLRYGRQTKLVGRSRRVYRKGMEESMVSDDDVTESRTSLRAESCRVN